MQEQKVLFLDFDGVINTDRMMLRAIRQPSECRDQYGLKFDPEAIAQLDCILQATGARLVAITSWKRQGLDQLQDLWQARHLPGHLSDATPDFRTDFVPGPDGNPQCQQVPFDSKGEEIDAWLLSEFLVEGRSTRYVILDDVPSFTPQQQPFFVQVDPHTGITAANAARAIAILNGEE